MEQLHTELRAANTLLKRGIKVRARAPFLLRLFFIKTITITLYQPYRGTLERAARYYLSTGLNLEKLQDITAEEALAVMADHGGPLTNAVSVSVLNGWIAGYLFTRPLSWYLKWHLTEVEIMTLMQAIISYGGLQDFMTTTRLVRSMKLTAPNLGQKSTKGS
ncbi:hypothetical protein [Pedobacter sp.]|uniref:hypothetical protein n=1 Tax=Pedobacter sp. TaxID=1411316 RepID=UPI00396CC54A